MKTKLVTSAVLLACSSLALADDALPVKFSGFGTFGAARSNNNKADFRLNPEQLTGTARTNHTDTTLDTKFALQADATLAKGLTATAQLMARKHGDNSSRAEFEWLNLRYQATRDLYVRGGRVQTPMFMLSEFQNVGYSLTALRVPQDVYPRLHVGPSGGPPHQYLHHLLRERHARPVAENPRSAQVPRGPSLRHCEECEAPIPQARRDAVPGVRLCVVCQQAQESGAASVSGYNRRGSKDSQLR